MISPPTSPDSTNFSDDISSTLCSDNSYNTLVPEMSSEKNYILKITILWPFDIFL